MLHLNPHIGFARLHIAEDAGKVSASMVIRDDFSFEVHMQGNQVQTQLFEIETVECVGDVMSNISSSRLCCGNQDDKFHPLSDVLAMSGY